MSTSRRAVLENHDAGCRRREPPLLSSSAAKTMADETKSLNDRPLVGCIGNGGMGRGDARASRAMATSWPCATSTVRTPRAFKQKLKIGEGAGLEIYEDYRKLLDRKDIDVVTISTPDHWHTKIAIDALRAGKDVYCQKPLTLTIDEGKLLCACVKETGRVLQVGTQQRSENKRVPDRRGHGAGRADRQDPARHLRHRRLAARRAVRQDGAARRARTGTSGSARPRWSTTSRNAATAISAGGTSTPAAS